jgi:xanthine dehydrogenase accessory factor
MDWLTAAQQLRHEGQPGVLVTVIEVRGHAPREAGAKMMVSRDRCWGSVGGGNLEATAVIRAREMIESGAGAPEICERQLNPHARNEHGRQCCGGVVRLLLEPLAVRPVVALFGIGHVGYELARILSRLPIGLLLVDSRAGQLDRVRLADVIDGSADVSIHHTLLGEQVLEQLPAGAHVVIMTHDHAEDFALCDAALRLGQALGGIGLIGSSVKWTRFQAQLAELGHGPEAIARITCPIGLPAITGKDPAVIAVAVAAELLASLTASQRAAAPPGLTSEERARREGGALRRPGGERESRASQRAAGLDWTDLPASQGASAPTGLTSEERARREGGVSRDAPEASGANRVSGKAE